MADLVIRGMNMPKSCDECRLFNESWCMALSVENWRKSYNKPPEGGRLPDCPLVPLPEGHGRLIDIEDVKSEKFHIEGRAEMYSAYNIGWNDALDAVCMNAHSIVPAEGETTNDGDA